jgi:hypothetical protein
MPDADAQFETFVARFDPDVAAVARGALAKLRASLPEFDALVYDNYNALAIGFSPDGKPGNSILSLAVYPRWASLFVSASLDDPGRILKGSGSSMRHVVLAGGAGDLERQEIASLIDQTRERARHMIVADRRGQLVIRSVSAKQRPRRPA